ncbi:MAG: hypothetical protein ACRD0N_05890 [Acidimicrobiales bacterium]
MAPPSAAEPAGDPATLQSLLTARKGADRDAPVSDSLLEDPVELFHHLETSRGFHRDSGLGRLFHPGATSLRENVRTNSLHVTIDDNRVSAHVDRVSPLGSRQERARYSLARVALHNLSGAAYDLGRLVRGRQGDHRCELDCEITIGPDGRPVRGAERELELLDPDSSAWSLHAEARVAGTIDEERLRLALAAVAPGDDVLEVVDCGDDDASVDQARQELQGEAVPVDQSPPFRVLLAHHEGGDLLMFNFNHAAADGPGALQVVQAFADAYEAEPPGRPEPLDFLAAHDLHVRPSTAQPKRLAYRYRTGLERVRDALARPTRLRPEHALDRPGQGFHMVTVEASDPASLAAHRDRDVDNDVLLAALHLAISAWNADHGLHGGRIAVLVPVDLRTRPWAREVGNLSVTARVSTTPAQRASPTAALRAVRAQTARNIRTRTGTALIDALDRHGLLPLWARQSVIVLQPLTRNRRLDSAVLSFVGRLDTPPAFGHEAGDATELWLSTPSRMPHGLSVGAAIVAGRLHLAFRHPLRLFGPAGARHFAECYLAQIRLVATAPPPDD